MKSTAGEIVEAEGGHIMRSAGRKDRHSKVNTSKGPRDRRVRLAAHTAIEFYDVQDRLGYDRPSKAVDWLIEKAKPSIDKLTTEQNAAGSSGMAIGEQSSESSPGYNFQLQNHLGDNNPGNHFPSVPNPITFFPTTSAATSSSLNFESYPPDIISSTNNSTQDLGLSLHSFQHHPGLIPWESQQEDENHAPSNENQALFTGSADPVGFGNHYQRILSWNSEATADHVNSEPFLGQGETLQSSFSPCVRTWNDIPMASSEHQRLQTLHQASIFGSRFLPERLVGFCVPGRIQGEQENNGVAPCKPSSASPSSHH